MEEENKLIPENDLVAQDVSNHIKFETLRQFLVKPLDPIKVKKEFSTPKPENDKEVTDTNGITAKDYSEVETEIKEVDSDFRRGVVLKVPFEYQRTMKDEKYPTTPIYVGNIVIYREKVAQWFDQLKDSQIVDSYNIFAVER